MCEMDRLGCVHVQDPPIRACVVPDTPSVVPATNMNKTPEQQAGATREQTHNVRARRCTASTRLLQNSVELRFPERKTTLSRMDSKMLLQRSALGNCF